MSKNNKDDPKKKPLPMVVYYMTAGISGMTSTCVVHPMDVIKNRLQMSKESGNLIPTFMNVIKNEGVLGFYTGLTASLLRQATYTTIRLGAYNHQQDFYVHHYPGKPPFPVLMCMAGVAGALGAYVGTPADVVLVRMTSDGRLPPDAFAKIVRSEGVLSLWKGSTATVGRAIVVNVSQLVTYSEVKHWITYELNMKEGVLLHLCSSVLSGLVATFNSMPFDIAKTRIQNLAGAGKSPSIISMMMAISRNEGVSALWKGFWPCYARLGPHSTITLIVSEKITSMYRYYVM